MDLMVQRPSLDGGTSRDDIPPNLKHIALLKKTLISACFACYGFVLIEFLPQGPKYNSQFFTRTVLPSVQRKLARCHPKLRATTARLHFDNIKPHTCKTVIENIEEFTFIPGPQLPHLPDIKACKFFLFVDLNR
jgi:hypothetical protein